jgi:diadenosine tetraphosphate (Ap4A) HIT family hydrolase
VEANCTFCLRVEEGHLEAASALAAAFADPFPLSPGHTLVVPRRHESDFFALSREEQSAVFSLAMKLHEELHARFSFDGMNIGINVGAAAGQTVGHAHLHLIPRYMGDVADPRGGIRWVLPRKARYWEEKS